MASKLLCKFFGTLTVVLSLACLAGCAAFPPASEPSATATLACQPSQVQTSKNGFAEIEGNMHTDGELWALLFFGQAHAKEDLKIVWKMTGADGEIIVQARHADGTIISPIWGPEDHGGSNWERPGHEWGTGFNFPKPGCWRLTATRGATIGEIRLEVLSP